MSTDVGVRDIEVSHCDDVGCAIPDILRDLRDGVGELVQTVEADVEGATATAEITPPHDFLSRIGDVLAEHSEEYHGVPSDRDAFAVRELEINVDGDSTVTIGVYE